MFEKLTKIQLVIFSIILGLAIVWSAKIITNSIINNTISTTGSAYKIVKSDSGSINFDIIVRKANKQDAYATLQTQIPIVKTFLESKGIDNTDIKALHGYYSYKYDPKTGSNTNEVQYYNLTQPITISSNNVELIKNLSNELSGLITKGIDINIYSPSYQYSEIAALKISLLEDATVDAKSRATAMLKPTGNKVGKLQSVRMGVFQITAPNSNNVSNMGINDDSTIDKKVTAVANATFKIN